MKPNIRLRSNVVLRGHSSFQKSVRGSEAVVKLLERRSPQVRGTQDGWLLMREASVLEPSQILDVAWQTACAHCGARPEGLVRGEVEFRCPVGRCPRQLPRARTVNFTRQLIDSVKSRGLDLHQTVQTALEKFGRQYSRQEPFPAREQVPIVVRLKPYQCLLYSGWTPRELSDVVEFAILRYFERARAAAEAGD